MVGVYKIINLVDNKCYYGSSKEIEKRWLRHKNELRKNKHINKILQRAWNKHEEENFIFEIVEECEESKLFQIEQKYLDLSPEYNIGLNACGGDNITNNPNRDIIIEKIKTSIKKWLDSLSEEEKKDKFSKPMEMNPNWKGGVTYVYCKCGKRIGHEHLYCNKCRPRSNKDNPFFGKKHSKEYKESASKRQMGKYNGEQNIPILIDGIKYRSYGEASKILKIPMTTIRWRVRSKNKKFENYKYKN
jgi:group I intron endonuclease